MIIKELYNKYKDIIPYLFFGICTTLTNTVVYWLSAHAVELPVFPSTVIAWFVAVLFAYITNRKWVFRSEARTAVEIIKELISFFVCRLATGVLDWGVMIIFVDVMKFNDLIIKIAANILVILLNYIASKLVIFKKNKK